MADAQFLRLPDGFLEGLVDKAEVLVHEVQTHRRVIDRSTHEQFNEIAGFTNVARLEDDALRVTCDSAYRRRRPLAEHLPIERV